MLDTAGFIRDGFVRVDQAFSTDVATRCRDLLWEQMVADRDDPTTWTSPVERLGYQEGGPFAEAVSTDGLRHAFDALVGVDRWMQRTDLGTFAIRFPADEAPGDDGWHIDASFPPAPPDDPADPFAWRVNLASRGRALLMLFLLSDTGENDAPTRLRVGSHSPVARLLEPYGDQGLTMMQISTRAAEATADHEVALATGAAGDVYLCHPLLVHAAQRHGAGSGVQPRFLAQPPLHPRGWVDGSLDLVGGDSPVEQAIREAISWSAPS